MCPPHILNSVENKILNQLTVPCEGKSSHPSNMITDYQRVWRLTSKIIVRLQSMVLSLKCNLNFNLNTTLETTSCKEHQVQNPCTDLDRA